MTAFDSILRELRSHPESVLRALLPIIPKIVKAIEEKHSAELEDARLAALARVDSAFGPPTIEEIDALEHAINSLPPSDDDALLYALLQRLRSPIP